MPEDGRPPAGSASPAARQRLLASGLVHGVGLTRHILRTAARLGLAGSVQRTRRGILVDLTGPRSALGALREAIRQAPAPARVDALSVLPVPADAPPPAAGLVVRPAEAHAPARTLLAPDTAPCADCRREALRPRQRRHRDVAIACPACGPRYSVIAALPYDATTTTLARFRPCAACARERTAPRDRRLAQVVITCPDCGPRAMLHTLDGRLIAEGDEALATAAGHLAGGDVLAVKGPGGFLLAAHARLPEPIHRLRARTGRRARPLAVCYPDLHAVAKDAVVRDDEATELASPVRPIVVLERRAGAALAAQAIAPDLDTVGALLPPSALLQQLVEQVGAPLVLASANRSGDPPAHRPDALAERLAGVVTLVLTDGVALVVQQEDPVVRYALRSRRRLVLRRGRGMAPLPPGPPLAPLVEGPPLVALGAPRTASVLLADGPAQALSQPLGDLTGPEGASRLADAIGHLARLLEVRAQVVAASETTPWPLREAAGLAVATEAAHAETIRDEEAHLFAVLGEHAAARGADWADVLEPDRPTLGVVWDDGDEEDGGGSSGGSALLVRGGHVEVVAGLRAVRRPRRGRLVGEPRRAAAAFTHGRPSLHNGLSDRFPVDEWAEVVRDLAERDAPRTGSMARLVDAAAALLDLGDVAGDDASAALRLDALAREAEPHALAQPVRLDQLADVILADGGETGTRLDGTAVLALVADDLDRGRSRAEAAWRFLDALAALVGVLAARTGAARIALAGSVFRLPVLVDRIDARLGATHELLWPRDLPPGDEALAWGQAVVTALRHRRRDAARRAGATHSTLLTES